MGSPVFLATERLYDIVYIPIYKCIWIKIKNINRKIRIVHNLKWEKHHDDDKTLKIVDRFVGKHSLVKVNFQRLLFLWISTVVYVYKDTLYKDNLGDKTEDYIFRNFYKTPLFRKNMSEEQKK